MPCKRGMKKAALSKETRNRDIRKIKDCGECAVVEGMRLRERKNVPKVVALVTYDFSVVDFHPLGDLTIFLAVEFCEIP